MFRSIPINELMVISHQICQSFDIFGVDSVNKC